MVSHFELYVGSFAINIALLSILGNIQVLPYLDHSMFHILQKLWSKCDFNYPN
jgi:hypothetical protein